MVRAFESDLVAKKMPFGWGAKKELCMKGR